MKCLNGLLIKLCEENFDSPLNHLHTASRIYLTPLMKKINPDDSKSIRSMGKVVNHLPLTRCIRKLTASIYKQQELRNQ